eukprot:102320-Prymnesium_polylepis.1
MMRPRMPASSVRVSLCSSATARVRAVRQGRGRTGAASTRWGEQRSSGDGGGPRASARGSTSRRHSRPGSAFFSISSCTRVWRCCSSRERISSPLASASSMFLKST